MKYYAYGSNLLAARLLARVDATDLGMATLPGYGLHWNYHSLDGSGKCNIEPSSDPSAVVHGVVYEMSEDAFEVLDRIEQGYDRILVTLAHRTGQMEAWVYVYAKPAPEAAPYDWYKGLVVAGAIEHSFPEAVIRDLQAVVSRPDPVHDRRGKLEAERLLREAQTELAH